MIISSTNIADKYINVYYLKLLFCFLVMKYFKILKYEIEYYLINNLDHIFSVVNKMSIINLENIPSHKYNVL